MIPIALIPNPARRQTAQRWKNYNDFGNTTVGSPMVLFEMFRSRALGTVAIFVTPGQVEAPMFTVSVMTLEIAEATGPEWVQVTVWFTAKQLQSVPLAES
jgi:hypothetical protein